MGDSSVLPYCPRCICEFCTAQRTVQLRNQQLTYEYEQRVDHERLERMTEENRIRELNDRVCAATWMLVMGHSRANQRDAVKTVAWLMEVSAGVVGGRVRTYVNRIQERLRELDGDPSGAVSRLRAAGALSTDDSWARWERDYLPVECTLCGGMYTEGRHCKRNSCRRKRGRGTT